MRKLILKKDGLFIDDGKKLSCISVMAFHPTGAAIAGIGIVTAPEDEKNITKNVFSFSTVDDDGFSDAPFYIFSIEELIFYPEILSSLIKEIENDQCSIATKIPKEIILNEIHQIAKERGIKRQTRNEVEIWTVYDHPRDYPNKIVARKFLNDKPTEEKIIEDTVEEVRKQLLSRNPNLTRFEPDPTDDIVILETWL